MSRLPSVGADTSQWGTILNDFLLQAHNADGSLSQAGLRIAGVVTDVAVAPATGVAATDSANIRSAIATASAAGGGYVWFQDNAHYVGDTAQFVVPRNVWLIFQQNTEWILNCTGGATVDALVYADHSGLLAQGMGGATPPHIAGSATINCRTLVSNADHGLIVTDAVTNGTSTVTSASWAGTTVTTAAGVGMVIGGTNIPNGSFIGQVNSPTSIGLSSTELANTPVNATGSGSGGTATVGGQQEFGYMSGIGFQTTGGGQYAVAIIEANSLFVNSGWDHLVVGRNDSSPVPGALITSGAVSGFGPFYVDGLWVIRGGGSCMKVTDSGNGACILWMDHLDLEHPADGFHNLELDGIAHLDAVHIGTIHTEDDIASATKRAGIYVNGVGLLTVENYMHLAGNVTNKVPVWITNTSVMGNFRVRIDGMENGNNVAPALEDDTGFGLNIATGSHIHRYSGPGYNGTHDGSLVFRYGSLVLGTQSITFANLGTGVNPQLGQYILAGQITGTVTIANPVNQHTGEELTYVFNQDATGHAVSWGTAFKVQATAVSTTASSWTVVSFIYNGTNWIQSSRSATA